MFAGMQAPPPAPLDSRKSLFLTSPTRKHRPIPGLKQRRWRADGLGSLMSTSPNEARKSPLPPRPNRGIRSC